MPLDPRARRFLDMIAVGGSDEYTVEARRDGLRRLARMAAGRPPDDVESRDFTIPGSGATLAARIYERRGLGSTAPGIVFFHGGGFVAGDLDTHDVMCRHLSVASRCRIVSVAYRLAPEHPFPAAMVDGYDSVAWVAANATSLGIDASRLAVAGSSAGGGIAARVCQEAAARGGPSLAAQLLLCPVLDAALDGLSRREFARGYLLDLETMRHDASAYGSDRHDPADPRLSPLRAPHLVGLPHAVIHTAEFDPVVNDGDHYAARLSESGIPVQHSSHGGMIHEFYGLSGMIPAAATLLSLIGDQIGTVLASPDCAVSVGIRPRLPHAQGVLVNHTEHARRA